MTPQPIDRTHWILTEDSAGTGFFISYKEKNYMISAKHIFPKASHGDLVEFQTFTNDLWSEPLKGNIYFHQVPYVDIAVIPVPKQANVPYFDALKIFTDPFLGDEGFLVGFPYDLGNQMAATNIKPFPMLKKVCFSGSSNHRVPILFFDGWNNPGFSGGPILFKDRLEKKSPWYVVAVTIGYYTAPIEFQGATYDPEENSGIIIAFSSAQIIDIILALNKETNHL